jgi:hypothetical protein
MKCYILCFLLTAHSFICVYFSTFPISLWSQSSQRQEFVFYPPFLPITNTPPGVLPPWEQESVCREKRVTWEENAGAGNEEQWPQVTETEARNTWEDGQWKRQRSKDNEERPPL